MKLLAIDDQSVVLRQIRAQIRLEQLGIEQLDTAVSTQTARELYQKSYYDIVLCDIEMPGEDGITFARWVLEKYPEVKLIFLTSHMDFAYMKQAIAMHSFDYVLQPANEVELNQTIQKAVFQIQIEQKQKEMLDKGKLYDEQENNIIDWMFMRYLTEGIPMEDYVQAVIRKRHPGLNAAVDICVVSVIIMERHNRLENAGNALAEFILTNITDELFEENKIKSFFIRNKEANFTGVLYSDGGAMEVEIIRHGLSAMKGYLFQLLDIKAAITFTGIDTYDQIRELYGRLDKYTMENACPKSEVTFMGDCAEAPLADQSLELHVRGWKKMLRSREFDSLGGAVLKYTDRLSASTLFSIYDIINIHGKFTEVLFSYLAENDMNTDCIFNDEMSYSDYMTKYVTLESFRSMVLFVIDRLKKAQSADLDPISLATQYIRKNIGETLSVTAIAEYVNLTPEHLTRLLKKSTGYSLKEYLTHERLEAAKMLLSTTTLSVTSIASHVGYDNYNNFTKIFKKYEDCTPSEYRKINGPTTQEN